MLPPFYSSRFSQVVWLFSVFPNYHVSYSSRCSHVLSLQHRVFSSCPTYIGLTCILYLATILQKRAFSNGTSFYTNVYSQVCFPFYSSGCSHAAPYFTGTSNLKFVRHFTLTMFPVFYRKVCSQLVHHFTVTSFLKWYPIMIIPCLNIKLY